MDYKEVIKSLISKKKIHLDDLIGLSIKYKRNIEYDLKSFILEYQKYNLGESEEDILKLLNGLLKNGYKFDKSYFFDFLEFGAGDNIIDWYINLGDEYKDNNALLYAAYAIESYENTLEPLLIRGFDPNFKEMDGVWFNGHYDGGYESCVNTYYLLLKYGYKFQNPITFCFLMRYVSKEFLNIKYDVNKFFKFPEIQKYMKLEYIEITEEHAQQFMEVNNICRDEFIEGVLYTFGYYKNTFTKYPNIIINIDNYTLDDYNKEMQRNEKYLKYPLIGFNDKFIQTEYLESAEEKINK
jgi:hypothetical protein